MRFLSHIENRELCAALRVNADVAQISFQGLLPCFLQQSRAAAYVADQPLAAPQEGLKSVPADAGQVTVGHLVHIKGFNAGQFDRGITCENRCRACILDTGFFDLHAITLFSCCNPILHKRNEPFAFLLYRSTHDNASIVKKYTKKPT